MTTQHRLDAPFGIEVEIPVDSALDDDEIAELRRLLAKHQLLVVRTKGLTADEQFQIAGYFGAPHGSPDSLKRLTNDAPGAAGAGELLFHSDYTYLTVPLYGISLYAESATPESAATVFANAALALERMPPALRARAEGRVVLHLYGRNNRGTRQRESDATAESQGAVHPLIWNSALTGVDVLGVTQLATARVIGMTEADSDALLDELFEHLYQPEHICVHHWQTGDLLIWDNIALQHSRRPGPVDGRRQLRRATFGLQGYEHMIREVFGWDAP